MKGFNKFGKQWVHICVGDTIKKCISQENYSPRSCIFVISNYHLKVQHSSMLVNSLLLELSSLHFAGDLKRLSLWYTECNRKHMFYENIYGVKEHKVVGLRKEATQDWFILRQM